MNDAAWTRVKHAFQDRAKGWRPLVKKPVEADEPELAANPRARSAKLRVAEWLGEGIAGTEGS